jgi:hypothetical protein
VASDIKDFRHAVSVLKKQGLLTGRTASGKKIDARSALPDWKIKGKKLSTLVKKYDDVVSGKATAVKVPPKTIKQFRKTGFETANKRVIVPHSKGELAKLQKGQIAIRSKSGIERVQIPVEYHNLQQYLRDLRKNKALINSMKKKRELFGIRFYGGQRAMFYENIEDLLDELDRYEDVQKYAQSPSKAAEIYRNLEILKMNEHGTDQVERQVQERKRKRSKEYNRRQAKRYRQRVKERPRLLKRYNEAAAKRMREYRKRLRGPQLAHYKKQARLRATKSNAKNKRKRKGKKKK